MSDLKHDPEFPYAIVFDGHVIAKFPAEGMGKVNAIEYAADVYDSELVDTTPKPKIPEDARFLHWFKDGGNFVATWENFNPVKPWELEGSYYTEEGLLHEIADSEVTVLVRKEES